MNDEDRTNRGQTLSHYSYIIWCESTKAAVVIDPARNASIYVDIARQHGLNIGGVIETHSHAEFVSGHLELHELTGAKLYVSKWMEALFPHSPFDDGDAFKIGTLTFQAISTPGHSLDSICVLVLEDSVAQALFTGDTLFVGDCGRPDLRESVSNRQSTRQDLSKHMFVSLTNKILKMSDLMLVFPSHGAGTLCGKSVGKAGSSTVGQERSTNWCLQPQTEEVFVQTLLHDQSHAPFYFPYVVEVNRRGAITYLKALQGVPFTEQPTSFGSD